MPTDRGAILAAPGMATSFEALARSYDHVVIDAGAAGGPEIEAIAAIAPHAILVAETLTDAGTAAARERLIEAGFDDVDGRRSAARRGELPRSRQRPLLSAHLRQGVRDRRRQSWQRIINEALG